MSCFVSVPNLPSSCSAVVYGEKYAEILEKSLESLHIRSILLPDNPDIDPHLSGHADLSMLHAGGEKLYLSPYLEGSAFAERMRILGAKLHFPEQRQSRTYPGDAQLNICISGKYVICNPKTADIKIAEKLTSSGAKFMSVRQGYSRCAVCTVDADSIITTDRGIAVAAESNGMHVLLIRPGYIRLEGYPYGFIGGASCKLASDKLAFTGSLDIHPDREAILGFLSERGISPVYLSQEPAFDIGSMIPLFEN